MDSKHKGVLKKFEALQGKLLIGKVQVKGANSNEKLPPDELVPEAHILHDLIRGFYKPAGKPYLLSYQATESEENYGKQIVWEEKGHSFFKIEMHPPNGEKDNRKKSDIEAARYNLINQIPIGILYKVKKGQNRVLGLGEIVSERADGVFIIEPYQLDQQDKVDIEALGKILKDEEINTDILLQVIQRRGQGKFKKKLLSNSQECEICGINETSLLIASHIKPWKDSSNFERMDQNNGILLCPNHDKLFDKGYITFSDQGKLLISSLLSETLIVKMNIGTDIDIKVNADSKLYLEWHRQNCFKK
ncbi:HNH endonuclease [Bacillus toyonensis]|uniref:HNH endonuclease n=1 Tax=Bacillus toyonensis TaxID=155322 RepID=UPI002E1A6A1D|nr:HNH endonuclease [Bacillus toyonensis]